MIASELFNSLGGGWLFRREINHNLSIKGQAYFEKRADNEFLYREDGFYSSTGKHKLAFYQQYLYQLVNGKINLFRFDYYGNTTPFVSLSFVNFAQFPFLITEQHHCGLDHYQVKFIFNQIGSFDQEIDVRGPRKSYLIKTQFRR